MRNCEIVIGLGVFSMIWLSLMIFVSVGLNGVLRVFMFCMNFIVSLVLGLMIWNVCVSFRNDSLVLGILIGFRLSFVRCVCVVLRFFVDFILNDICIRFGFLFVISIML